MRIAVNTRTLLLSRMEGVGRFTYELTKRMVLAHPEDEFYFFFDRDYDPSFVFAENVFPIVLSPQARHPFLWYWWFESAIPKALKKYNCDVFFSPDGYLSLKTKIPTLLASHDLAYLHNPEHLPSLVRWYANKYFPKYHNHATHIATVSTASKEDIIREYKIDKKKITVTYNGCSEEFKEISSEEKEKIKAQYSLGKPYFIYVGSIHPRKNIARLIQSFDQFCHGNKDHQLLVVGRWAWKTEKIRSALKNATHKSRIKILDYHDDSVAPLIAASDGLVYISLHEGFGLPLLEAMQCGVPILTSNLSSMPEVVGDSAILVDPKNNDAIVKALHQLAKKNKEKTSYEVQLKKFSWSESSESIYEILSKIRAKH